MNYEIELSNLKCIIYELNEVKSCYDLTINGRKATMFNFIQFVNKVDAIITEYCSSQHSTAVAFYVQNNILKDMEEIRKAYNGCINIGLYYDVDEIDSRTNTVLDLRGKLSKIYKILGGLSYAS